MDSSEAQANSIRRALERGFQRDQARRLAFVRWSLHEGYAQFSEDTTSDDPVVETRPGFEPMTAMSGSRREASD